MKIIIFGFDEFGEKVAKLINDKDIIIVTLDEKEYTKALEFYKHVIFLENITDELIKKIKEIELADLIIALLADEDKNLFLCLTLKDLYNDKKILAKVNKKENEFKYKLIGVEKTINPYEVISNRIITILKKPLTLKVIESIVFEDNKLSFEEITIPENSFLDKKYIKDVQKDINSLYNILVIGIIDKEISDNLQFIAKGFNHKIDAGDIIVVVGDLDEIERFKNDLKVIKNG